MGALLLLLPLETMISNADPDPPPLPTLTRSTAINIAGAVLPGIVLIISTPLYLRFIGTDRYGILSIIWLLLGYFGAFDLGVGRAAANQIARMQHSPTQDRSALFWTALCISFFFGTIGGGIVFFLGNSILTHLFHLTGPLRVEAKVALPWIALSLPLVTVISLLNGALEGRQAFLELNVGQSTGLIFSQIIPLVMASLGKESLDWLVAGALLGRFLGALILFIYCRRHVPILSIPEYRSDYIRPLFHYGMAITISNIVNPLLTVFDRFAVGAMKGMTAVTLYTVPFRLVNYLSVFPRSLTTALFPKYASVSPKKAHYLLLQAITTISVVMTPIVLIGITFMPIFLSIWVGKDFSGKATTTALILLGGIWVNSIAYAPSSYLQARGRPDITARFHLLELIPYMATLWILVSQMGVLGAAWSWTARVTADAILLLSAGKAARMSARVLLPPVLLVGVSLTLALCSPESTPWRMPGEIALILFSVIWSYKRGSLLLRENRNASNTDSSQFGKNPGSQEDRSGKSVSSDQTKINWEEDTHAEGNDRTGF